MVRFLENFKTQKSKRSPRTPITRITKSLPNVKSHPPKKEHSLERIQSWFGVIKATNQRPTEREQLCCECVSTRKTPDQFSNWSKASCLHISLCASPPHLHLPSILVTFSGKLMNNANKVLLTHIFLCQRFIFTKDHWLTLYRVSPVNFEEERHGRRKTGYLIAGECKVECQENHDILQTGKK